ncbi:putative umta [Phaeomoniella chlamydospora]|uniref:Putative umta n=1 Tax=Phaeomoniella chlamydospora TaxID=158046 RepID=A0A0G2G0F8_PHACM|nr:putative umta [Phaeomoniella chlamydospora]
MMEDNAVPTPAEDPFPQLVPTLDEDGNEDNDSAYAGSITNTETTSLRSSILRYKEENGRTYHAYGSTEHWGPNDERAQDQQDLSHHLWTLALKGEYFIAPVVNPQDILDLGTGTGIWVMDVADQQPQAAVRGIDLSPIQPSWTPPNARFEIDDYNADWIDADRYDLIHARELLGSVPDWVELYRKAYRALKPGGWFDQAEPSLFFVSDHIKLSEDHPYPQWGKRMKEAGEKAGMRFDIGQHIKEWLEEAGFINVQEKRMAWTIGGWAKDKHLREIGQWNQVRLDIGVRDFCSRRFTNNMGWKPEEVEVFCAKLRAAFRDPKLYGYQWAYFVCGQRPLE